uniref:Pyruvate, phosphate dikinase regulatory protein, chloroplastic n=1 Tax=Tanacetum cinerariifolium TaxID=118510 RepID=A0A6L2M7D7_TANCI|nr:hypothetical protein [Tanacetum cinerariifolium]
MKSSSMLKSIISNKEELAFLADPGITEDALAEVHNPNNVDNNMINQESQQAAVQNSKTSAEQDSLILFVIEQLKTQVTNCTKINLDNKSVNESLIVELERYKEQVKVLKEGKNIENTYAIVIPHYEETLMLPEECHSKMILKQQDLMVLENKNSMNSSDPNPSKRPTKVEVLKELPKVSMVNTSLKKLKQHLAGLDVVVKERTTSIAITEGPDNSVSNQCALCFDQYIELNELKAQSQEKDTVISKLKERIKSLSDNVNKDKVKKDIKEIETINIELDHRVSKLIAENEQLKQTYKKLYDSIKSTRVRSKEQSDALINQVNLKSVEISDLNANLQEQGLIITTLKDELRKLKRKAIVDTTVTTHTIDPEMLKVDVEPIDPRLLNNKTVHSDYHRLTQEQAAILKEVVEQGKS